MIIIRVRFTLCTFFRRVAVCLHMHLWGDERGDETRRRRRRLQPQTSLIANVMMGQTLSLSGSGLCVFAFASLDLSLSSALHNPINMHHGWSRAVVACCVYRNCADDRGAFNQNKRLCLLLSACRTDMMLFLLHHLRVSCVNGSWCTEVLSAIRATLTTCVNLALGDWTLAATTTTCQQRIYSAELMRVFCTTSAHNNTLLKTIYSNCSREQRRQ